MKNIIIITSNKLRHDYFRIMFSVDKNINVLKSYVEVEQNKEIKKNLSSFEKTHFVAKEKTENDFFSDPISLVKDFSKSKQMTLDKMFLRRSNAFRALNFFQFCLGRCFSR